MLNNSPTLAKAIAICEDEAAKSGYSGVTVESSNWLDKTKLFDALNVAANCEALIAPEQERLARLLTEAKESGNEIEIAAREFQIEYVEKHLTRAAAIARKRIEYFKTLTTQAVINTEIERVKTDKDYYFEMYCWGYDPRARTPLSIVPFGLLPKQKELVEWLDETVFYRRTSGLIEKPREEGVTEIIVRWGLHNWRFYDGFSMLLSTRTEDEVDTKKKQGTLFERMRFQLRLWPAWLLPEGFDINKGLLPDMMISNPANGNELTGQAPVENMGRGDRVTCALFDELAFWRFAGYPQYRSMSFTTDSIISPSSVSGEFNQFADLAHDGVTRKFEMDWRENPFKDKRWYDSLPYGYIAPKMSRTTIAQEVDKNYRAAQPGAVWKFKEELIFITQDEFLEPYRQAKLDHLFFDERGRFKIPHDFRVTRTSDYGQSAGHDWSYGLFGQPRANYPYSDTHFCFVNLNLEPNGLTTEEAVKLWRGFEEEYGLRDAKGWIHKPHASWNSHEQKDLRKVLSGTYGENWTAWKAGESSYQNGIEQIQDWWTPIEVDKPNPFRPHLNGRCRLVFVAPPGEYECSYNEKTDQWFVTTSKTERGFYTARKQYAAYHYDEAELGKAVKAMRPVKEFDDIVDNTRGYAVMWNIVPESKTEVEIFNEKTRQVTAFNRDELKDDISVGAQISRSMAAAKVLKEMKEDGYDLEDLGVENEREFLTDISGGY